VEDSYASRVTGYFVDGANSVGMLDNGRLMDNVKVSDEERVRIIMTYLMI